MPFAVKSAHLKINYLNYCIANIILFLYICNV
nr:MAG TPA: hypothetical protein [Caudoviricetes sp.]